MSVTAATVSTICSAAASPVSGCPAKLRPRRLPLHQFRAAAQQHPRNRSRTTTNIIGDIASADEPVENTSSNNLDDVYPRADAPLSPSSPFATVVADSSISPIPYPTTAAVAMSPTTSMPPLQIPTAGPEEADGQQQLPQDAAAKGTERSAIPSRSRTMTTTAEIDSTITKPGSVKINVTGAFIVDPDTATPKNGRGSPTTHHETSDIRLPNHTAVVSHIAVDVREKKKL